MSPDAIRNGRRLFQRIPFPCPSENTIIACHPNFAPVTVHDFNCLQCLLWLGREWTWCTIDFANPSRSVRAFYVDSSNGIVEEIA